MIAAAQRQEAFRELEAREAMERTAAARLAAAVDAAELGFSDRDLANLHIFVDDRMRELLDVTDSDDPRVDLVWLSRIDATDREHVAELARQLRAGEIERAVTDIAITIQSAASSGSAIRRGAWRTALV